MPVMNSLTFDHLYISLPENSFKKYINFFTDLNGVHSVVNSSDDSWEGLYLKSRIGDYFEILNNKRNGGLGIALSPLRPMHVEVSNIIKEQPHLDWKHGKRLDGQNRPWFDWYSLDNYLDAKNLLFNVWIMDYAKSHNDVKAKPKTNFVDSFNSIELSLGSAHLSKIEDNLKFTDYKIVKESNYLKFSIPKNDGWNFDVIIRIIDGDSEFTPIQLTLNTYKLDHEILKKYDFIELKDKEVVVRFDKS